MVQCARHGTLETVFICDHTLLSLRDNVPRGLHMWRDGNGNVCAYCGDCLARAEASGSGKDHVPVKFQVETLCAKCFEPIKAMNGFGRSDRGRMSR